MFPVGGCGTRHIADPHVAQGTEVTSLAPRTPTGRACLDRDAEGGLGNECAGTHVCSSTRGAVRGLALTPCEPSLLSRTKGPLFSGACCGSSSFASTCSSGVPVTRCQGHTVCSSPGQQDAVPALPERCGPFHGPHPEKQNHTHAPSTGSEGLPMLSSGPWLTDSRCRVKRDSSCRRPRLTFAATMLRPIPFCFFRVTVMISGSFLRG